MRSRLVEFGDEEAIAFWLRWRGKGAIAVDRVWDEEVIAFLFWGGDRFLVEIEMKGDRFLIEMKIECDRS